MFDTHCHLTDPRLFEQLGAVLSRAASAGLTRMVSIGTDPPDWDAALALCRDHANVRCALGVHPNHCGGVEIAEVDRLRELAGNPSVVALGEMGLDYHYGDVPRSLQADFFQRQLSLAQELGFPVVIHCREALDDCLAVIKSFRVSAVFHCFTGTRDEARRVLDAGYMLGFTGVVTFRNGGELRQIAAEAPVDRILVETDAPYLSPEPMRKQKINEPALVVHTAAAIAAARGLDLAELDQLTTANACRFYRWEC